MSFSSSTEDSIKILLRESSSGETDFILCSHERAARLLKISNGLLSEGIDYYWAGNSQAVTDFQKVVSPIKYEGIPGLCTAGEVEMKANFFNFLLNSNYPDIGGLAIDCICSPYGHCYNSTAGSFAWDTVHSSGSRSLEHSKAYEEHTKTGMHHFSYTVNASLPRGVPVLSAFFPQADTGYLYDATKGIDPQRISPCTGTELHELLNEAALKALFAGTSI